MGDGKEALRFSGRQIALAHLIVPFTETIPIIEDLVEWIRTTGESGTDEASPVTPPRIKPRVVQMAGQVDIVLAVEIPSFRQIFQYNKIFGRKHVSCQWILARELSLPDSWGVKSADQVDYESHGIAHCFFTHLRVQRQAYGRLGHHAEQQVVQSIAESLRRFEIPGTISVGLGWSDLIVHGLLKDQEKYCRFIADLQCKTLDLNGRHFRPFQRTVSLLGYLWNQEGEINPGLERSKPVRAQTFSFRVAPGRLKEAYDQVQTFLESLVIQPSSKDVLFRYELTTGKSDILAFPTKKDAMLRNLHLDPAVRFGLDALRSSGVESIETHIQTLDPSKLLDRYSPPAKAESFEAWRPEELLAELEGIDEKLQNLPSGIRESISALYELFKCLLRDFEQSHDLNRIIKKCHLALQEPIQEFHDFQPLSNTESTSGRFPDAQFKPDTEERLETLDRVLEEMRVWCSRTEKILSERSESFQEIFSRSSRLSSFRGSVQTDLMTADFLIDEFYEQLEAQINDMGGIKKSVFHYGATDTIESQLKGGLVTTIPSKYLFSLPLAIPQLWMEAAVRAFNHLDGKNGGLLRQRASNFIFEESRVQGIRVMESRELLRYLADLYGDLCVCFIGFGNFHDFSRFLVTLALRSPANLQDDAGTRMAHWEDILQRLFFVRECELLMINKGLLDEQGENLARGARLLPGCPDPTEAVVLNPDGQLEKFYKKRLWQVTTAALETMRLDDRSRLRDHPRRKPLGFETRKPLEINIRWNNIMNSVWRRRCSIGFQICHMQYLWEFINNYRKPSEPLKSPQFQQKIKSMERGWMQDLSNEPFLNPYIREGYITEVNDVRLGNKKPKPQGMAALERSILLAFFKKKYPAQ